MTFNVLILCTGNSARSILAECIVNRLGEGRFTGFSAGSDPKDEVHPYALRLLKEHNYATDKLRSKSWDNFAGPDAPSLDFVFTVCDNAAGEVCPIFPGHPLSAHWGLPDPAAETGTDERKQLAFAEAYQVIYERISVFVTLPLQSLDRPTLRKQLYDIGNNTPQFDRK